jgi:hypothetical protein
MFPVATCFALHNLLAAFGTSGKATGQPDVPTVLALVAHKLVVPVSLILESWHDGRWPRMREIFAVILVMMGIAITASAYRNDDNDDDNDENSSGAAFRLHRLKLTSLLLCNIPLALGFLLVKRATTGIPALAHVSELELWFVLCIPETILSAILSLVTLQVRGESSRQLWNGMACIALATAVPTLYDNSNDSTDHHAPTSASCADAAKYIYVALIPGIAYNWAIPVLVKALHNSTGIPLMRAVALPLAATIAMMPAGIVIDDPLIHSPFSWQALVGLIFAFAGLVVFVGVRQDTSNTTNGTSIQQRPQESMPVLLDDEHEIECQSIYSNSSLAPSAVMINNDLALPEEQQAMNYGYHRSSSNNGIKNHVHLS